LTDKLDLRRWAKERRAAQDPAVVQTLSTRVAAEVLGWPAFHVARRVALFSALPNEADPIGLEAPLLARGAAVFYPRVDPVRRLLEFFLATKSELRPGHFGILEPPKTAAAGPLELIVVPALAFSRSGHRLGFGRGYYDRAISEARAAAPTLAVGFGLDWQVVPELPTEPHDQRLDALATESGLISFVV
jgi:5-formyltetrahydrofolate cyclo-ligase